MKKYVFLPALLLVFSQADAQIKPAKPKISIASVTTLDGQVTKGILYSLTDSSVLLYTLSTAIQKEDLEQDSLSLQNFTYRNIKSVKVRKRSSLAKSAAIGGGLGFLLGVVIDEGNQATSQAFNAITGEEVGFSPVFTFTIALIGTGAGAIVGSITKKFKINGDGNAYNTSEYAMMKKYAFVKKI